MYYKCLIPCLLCLQRQINELKVQNNYPIRETYPILDATGTRMKDSESFCLSKPVLGLKGVGYQK